MKSRCGHALYWHNCYTDRYDLIAPESMAHPAKMSPTLGFRVIEHLEELGILNNGDVILDPMAGTGLTNICAGAKGYKSISVELEDPFIEFQKQNKEYAERRLFKALDWQIIKGDSRELSVLLSEKGLVTLTSPPYGEVTNAKKNTGSNLSKEERLALHGERTGELSEGMRYSHSTNNIGNLPDRPIISVTSPPYADIEKRDRSIEPSNESEENLQLYRGDRNISAGYQAAEPNNIGNLPDKPIISFMSPPYEDSKIRDVKKGVGDAWEKEGYAAHDNIAGYGKTEGQIGRKGEQGSSESYLSAMLKVYWEIAKVSDTLVIIIKNPTRDKKLRRLDVDTIKILGMAGWNIYCQHRAILFEELEQATLFGETTKMVKGRISFFKRLSWQNGQPVASWEDIIIAKRGE